MMGQANLDNQGLDNWSSTIF